MAAGGLDPAGLTRRAAAKAAFAGDPAALGPGTHTVVFEASAVGTLLELLGGAAFDGLAHAEGRGALAGRLGERVAAPAVNLSDSPRFAATLQRGIDAEGTPKVPVPLIQDGVAHGVVHDLRSAALAGARSTGNALAPGGDPEGPRPTNLVLIGGGAADEEELCAPRGARRLRDAALVREPRAPGESLVTAVTRDGTFLIEDGRITAARARPAADRQVLGILARTAALGARQELVSEGEFYGRRFATRDRLPAAAGRRRALHGLGRRVAQTLSSAITFATNSSANPIVQRFRLRSTSEPPPKGPAPVPTPKAPESPESLPECMRMSTIRTTARIT